jgi:hypothetical protein
LRAWAAAEPGDADVAIALASALEQAERLDEAKKLLLPIRAKLGDGEGARVLGLILAREGDWDGSHALLWPYVDGRLARLRSAEQAAEQAAQQLWDREIDLLKHKKGPADFYERYESASASEQQAMVQDYISGRMKTDPLLTRTQEAMERASAVVPVALELGIVALQRAQGTADPVARKARLEAAEKVFLAVGGVVGRTDEYRLSLGQVYYWLGRQAEGKKLFDAFVAAKNRSAEALLRVASNLRQLGAGPEARAMVEEAYSKARNDDERHQAAGFRAVMFKDVDDQIAWLGKADAGDARVKASLAKARGDRAFRDGRDDEAAREFRAAADALAALPRGTHTLNEGALAYYAIFQVTGDKQALDRCTDYFQQAADLQPKDTVLLFNAGATLLSAALGDVIGADIDLRALHGTGSIDLLGYLYKDEAGRAAVARRVASHPGVARAMGFLDKVTVLSPKEGRAFAMLHGVHRFTRNEPALRALEQRARAADLDTSDEVADVREFLAGTKEAERRATIAAAIKRQEPIAAAVRPKGGRTAAVAIVGRVELMLGADLFAGNGDMDRALALAEEAHALAPSVRTAGAVSTVHYYRAVKDLRRGDPAFDAYCGKYVRVTGLPTLVVVLLSEPGPFKQKVAAHPDVRAALAMARAESQAFADGYSAEDWAALKEADPAEAERAAASLRASAVRQASHALSALLRPANGAEALEGYWLMQARNKPAEAKAELRRVIGLGVPMPIQP